ncbi:MAG: hypothetical protein LUG93_14765 [Lachnospiraceae bacterium]|nr:hypothetical protein [Lachnospiraceae bacterium]
MIWYCQKCKKLFREEPGKRCAFCSGKIFHAASEGAFLADGYRYQDATASKKSEREKIMEEAGRGLQELNDKFARKKREDTDAHKKNGALEKKDPKEEARRKEEEEARRKEEEARRKEEEARRKEEEARRREEETRRKEAEREAQEKRRIEREQRRKKYEEQLKRTTSGGNAAGSAGAAGAASLPRSMFASESVPLELPHSEPARREGTLPGDTFAAGSARTTGEAGSARSAGEAARMLEGLGLQKKR